jgi:hypothetical protein
MKNHFITIRNGKKRVCWLPLFAFVAGTYAALIGAAEVFWLGFTGGFSPLVGGYALVAATLVVIRVVVGSLTMPGDLLRAQEGGV